MPNKIYAGLILFVTAVVAAIFMLGFIFILPLLLLAGVIFFYIMRKKLEKMRREAGESGVYFFTMGRNEQTFHQNHPENDDSGGTVINVEPTKARTIKDGRQLEDKSGSNGK